MYRRLTTCDIAAHFAKIYGAQVSKDTISRITDRVLGEMAAWTSRPLEHVYLAIFIDAIVRREVLGHRVKVKTCTTWRGSGWVKLGSLIRGALGRVEQP